MGNIMGVRWELATPLAIQINEHDDVWHSGHVADVLPLDDGRSGLLVATHTGGVWVVTAASALPLSDTWNHPDTACLAAGPDGPRHIYAGADAGVIYETNSDAALPLLDWRPIDRPLPEEAGVVKRILVLPRHQRLVAVCTGGIFWSRTVGSVWTGPKWRRISRPRYVWYPATEVDGSSGGYYDGAIGGTRDVERPGQDDLEFVTIVAGALNGGIWTGQWAGDDLQLIRTMAMPAVGATSVASSDLRAGRVFGAAALRDGRLGGLCRSDDGGLNWSLVQAIDRSGNTLADVAGDQGNGWNNCISVLPDRPDALALGWHHAYASVDAGRNWTQIAMEQAHLHSDIQVIRTASAGLNPGAALYVGSDGGVAELDLEGVVRLAEEGPQAGYPAGRSNLNRSLASLQFYATASAGDRKFAGTAAVSLGEPQFVTAGLQDNGNVFSRIDGGAPWLKITGGDGGVNGIWDDDLFTTQMADAEVARATIGGGSFAAHGSVPVGKQAGGGNSSALVPSALDPVRRPSFRNASGDLMVQVAGAADGAAQQRGVFGLFSTQGGAAGYYWERLGDVPADGAISAVASTTGGLIWVGTAGARIFALDSTGATATVETPVPPLPRRSVDEREPTGVWVMRIATERDGRAYALVSAVYAGGDLQSYVLRLDGLKWVITSWTPALGTHPADSLGYGLEVVPRVPRDVVFVSTDSRVYASDDEGSVWHDVSDGLPVRAHGADLRFAYRGDAQPGSGSWLYLGTFGRSMWRASMDHLDHG